MWLRQFTSNFSGGRRAANRRAAKKQAKRFAKRAGKLETLEDRYLLTAYMQTNLVSDQAGSALLQDPKLIAPWGITQTPDGNFWVADSGSSAATIYTANASGTNSSTFAKDSLAVTLPGGLPTGVVTDASGPDNAGVFSITDAGPSGSTQVLFDSANGNLLGETSVTSTLAELASQVSGAVYTGLAIGTINGANYLFAADFQNGSIDVFNTEFQLVGSIAANGHAGYSPFNVQVMNGELYITYAKYTVNGQGGDNDDDDQGDSNNQASLSPQDAANDHGNGHGNGNGNGNGPGNGNGHGNGHGHQGHKGHGGGPGGPGQGGGDNDDDDGLNDGGGPSGVRLLATGSGFVDAYSLNALLDSSDHFLLNMPNSLWSDSTGLDAPWGLAMAPSSFGDLSGALLVGNFGNGEITALDNTNGHILSTGTDSSGHLLNPSGNAITIDHLLGLTFGSGTNTLYFTSAPTGGVTPVGSGGSSSAMASIIVLDQTGSGALTAVGNANVAVSGGGVIAVDSGASDAITASGNAQVAAGTIDVSGSIRTNGNANVAGDINSGFAPVADPLASLAPPTASNTVFSQTYKITHGHVTLKPGVYAGGIQVSGQASVFLQPGIYVLQGGGLQITGGASVVGNGVLLYNNPTTASQGIQIAGHGSLTLSGLTTAGPYQGIAIFQARDAGSPISVSGQGEISVQGIIYAPSAPLEVSGQGRVLALDECFDNLNVHGQLIVYDLNVVGNGTVGVSGAASGGNIIGVHGLLGSLQPATATNPLVITGGGISATEGATFSGAVAAFAASASGAVAGDFTANIDWGDGHSSTGTVTATGNGGFLVLGNHTFAEEGGETITVTVNDNTNHTVSSAASVQVADAPLIATGVDHLSVPDLTVNNLQVASVIDTGGTAGATYTATIDWGDGTTSAGTINVNGNTVNISGSTSSYTVPGRYVLTVTVNDGGGASTVVHTTLNVGSPAPTNLYVCGAFDAILNRPIGPDSLKYFADHLQNGLPRYVFASGLTHSDEYLENQIQGAYQSYLGRDADQAGLIFWLNAMQGGMTIERLDALFIGSPEFYAYAGGSDRLWIDHMYFDILGRGPDTAGETFWLNALAGGESRSQVALGFAASPEHESIIIRNDYETFLNRAPSLHDLEFWVGQFTHGVHNEDVVAGFCSSNEFYDAHSHAQGSKS